MTIESNYKPDYHLQRLGREVELARAAVAHAKRTRFRVTEAEARQEAALLAFSDYTAAAAHLSEPERQHAIDCGLSAPEMLAARLRLPADYYADAVGGVSFLTVADCVRVLDERGVNRDHKSLASRAPVVARATLRATTTRRGVTVSLAINAGVLPTEFKLFAPGRNETTKGAFIFDEQAAREVMAAYRQHGVDLSIDLEHLSLEDPVSSRNFDPDARGWCKLEVRRDGSLWAVQVSWTPDGAARLRERRQRYVSPAFDVDPNTRRIREVHNVAITAIPATHKTMPLVAARH